MYNYCRRSKVLTDFLVADFKLLVLGYFDDRFGMTRDTFAEEEALLVTKVCDMFGVMVNNKTDFGDNIAFLGVGFDFSAGVLYVLDQRRKKIMAEIINIIKSNLLPFGQAAKLKGKLMFITNHYKGRHGRPYLRELSERQHGGGRDFHLNPSLTSSLLAWYRILDLQPDPRQIFSESLGKPADVVIFTDGAFRDGRPWVQDDSTKPMIGWTTFVCGALPAADRAYFGRLQVRQSQIDQWAMRLTQISMVELLAAVAAIDHHAPQLTNRQLLLLVDSEEVESALVKGYSGREDRCDLITMFWDKAPVFDIAVFVTRVPTDSNPGRRTEQGFCR